MKTTAAFPKPLSETPTVEALETLLHGLHTPMQRGVPGPPAADAVDLTGLADGPVEPAAVRWSVEHPPTGVPVHLAVGDELTPDELWLLRLNLDRGVEAFTGTPLAPVTPPPAPTPHPVAAVDPAPTQAAAPTAGAPAPLSWSAASSARPRPNVRAAAAVAVGLAAAVASTAPWG